MCLGIRVLSSKLLIPGTSETIERPRLMPFTGQITKKLLTIVTAGAGYGKTTLVAQSVKGSDVVWYRLDRSDGDLNTAINLDGTVAGGGSACNTGELYDVYIQGCHLNIKAGSWIDIWAH
jgi:hypothetical protein